MRNRTGDISPSVQRQATEPCMDQNTFNSLLRDSPSTAYLLDNCTIGTLFEGISGMPDPVAGAQSGSIEPASSQAMMPSHSHNASGYVEVTPSTFAAALRRANFNGVACGGAAQGAAIRVPEFVSYPHVLPSGSYTSDIQGVMQVQKQVQVVQTGPASKATVYVTNTKEVAAAPCTSQVANALHPGYSTAPSSSSFEVLPHSPETEEASQAVEALFSGKRISSGPLSLSQLSDLPDLPELNDADFASESKFNPSQVVSKKELEVNAENLPRSDSIDVMQLTDWEGDHNFTISFPTDARNSRKWGYCDEVKRVFCQPNIAIEVQVQVDDWTAVEGRDAKVRLCPVYTDAHHRTTPVNRCDHHKLAERLTDKESVEIDYLIQIDHKSADYGQVGNRQVVYAPLQPSRLGEEFATLLVKCSCMTSCVGGPNRRPFAVIFSLMVEGREAGRRVLPIKCCKGVSRDMKAEKNRLQAGEGPAGDPPPPSPQPPRPRNNTHTITINLEGKKRKDRSTPCSSDSERSPGKKVRANNRLVNLPESAGLPTPSGYCNVLLPLKYKQRVMDYLSALRAQDYLREKHPDVCKRLNI